MGERDKTENCGIIRLRTKINIVISEGGEKDEKGT